MDKSVKIKRVESVLKELIPEAISQLSDASLRGLCVVDVECSRGKYDAVVYLDASFVTLEEEPFILKQIAKASGFLENYCKQMEGWFRCPKFHFKFDHNLEKQNKMDDLFDKIHKDLNKNG